MRFILQNPTGIYFSNDSIQGYFIFDTKIPTKLSWISLELIGRLSVSFSVKGNTKNESGIFTSSRILMNENGCLWRKRGIMDDEFPVGSHNFDFSFWIPENCLPSFSSLHGNITYILKAKLFNSKGIYKFYEMPINVCKKYNVMENPSLLQSKTISNLSLSHKPKLTVPRSVAIIGQPISLLIELENSSYYAIKSIIVGIGMRIIYKGKSKDLHFKENEKTVSKVLWKKEVPFNVSQNNYGIIQQKVPTNNVETETINDSAIKINYCLFVKFFSKQKILCSELSLPITFAKSFLSVLNAPPPPYYVNTCNSDTDIENIDFNLSIHPPTYDDVLSS